jgi:capsular exopolysaccharide synthesis family protein
MTEEGKFSRAMAKSAGATSSIFSAPPTPVAEAPPAPRTAATAHAAPAAVFQRIKDHWGPPTASVMLFHDRGGQFASQMRSLRANIAALNNGVPPRVITVTSAGREEGKTTVCANLAAALGEVETGRIIIVDGDIVQPSLHLTMNVRVQSGLRDVLREGLKLDGHIYETAIPNVDILPSFGIGPDEGFEGPLHQRCPQLLALLRKYYSYVIIDTPPVLAGSPAATFAKHSDGVILIARLEQTRREVVKRTADDLTDAGAKLIGCVLTHQKHHVPDLIYRFLGTTPTHYYRYGRDRRTTEAGAPRSPASVEAGRSGTEEAPPAKTSPLQQVKSSETE